MKVTETNPRYIGDPPWYYLWSPCEPQLCNSQLSTSEQETEQAPSDLHWIAVRLCWLALANKLKSHIIIIMLYIIIALVSVASIRCTMLRYIYDASLLMMDIAGRLSCSSKSNRFALAILCSRENEDTELLIIQLHIMHCQAYFQIFNVTRPFCVQHIN